MSVTPFYLSLVLPPLPLNKFYLLQIRPHGGLPIRPLPLFLLQHVMKARFSFQNLVRLILHDNRLLTSMPMSKNSMNRLVHITGTPLPMTV